MNTCLTTCTTHAIRPLNNILTVQVFLYQTIVQLVVNINQTHVSKLASDKVSQHKHHMSGPKMDHYHQNCTSFTVYIPRAINFCCIKGGRQSTIIKWTYNLNWVLVNQKQWL